MQQGEIYFGYTTYACMVRIAWLLESNLLENPPVACFLSVFRQYHLEAQI